MLSESIKNHPWTTPHKKIAGVCIRMAKIFDMPLWAMRLTTIIAFLMFPFYVLVVYGAIWLSHKGE